jgi:hypothetical protein
MDIVKDVKEILKLQDTHEKRRQIEQISDVLEYWPDLSEKDVAEGSQLLLAAALQEEDEDLQESLFHAANHVVACQSAVNLMDWDGLAASLPSLGIGVLDYALGMLGISGQARYLPALEEYTHHADPEVRESAQEAISELKHQLALAAGSQREGKLTA